MEKDGQSLGKTFAIMETVRTAGSMEKDIKPRDTFARMLTERTYSCSPWLTEWESTMPACPVLVKVGAESVCMTTAVLSQNPACCKASKYSSLEIWGIVALSRLVLTPMHFSHNLSTVPRSFKPNQTYQSNFTGSAGSAGSGCSFQDAMHVSSASTSVVAPLPACPNTILDCLSSASKCMTNLALNIHVLTTGSEQPNSRTMCVKLQPRTVYLMIRQPVLSMRLHNIKALQSLPSIFFNINPVCLSPCHTLHENILLSTHARIPVLALG